MPYYLLFPVQTFVECFCGVRGLPSRVLRHVLNNAKKTMFAMIVHFLLYVKCGCLVFFFMCFVLGIFLFFLAGFVGFLVVGFVGVCCVGVLWVVLGFVLVFVCCVDLVVFGVLFLFFGVVLVLCVGDVF